jgi:hypothetical protein
MATPSAGREFRILHIVSGTSISSFLDLDGRPGRLSLPLLLLIETLDLQFEEYLAPPILI